MFKFLALMILILFYSLFLGKQISQRKAGIKTKQIGAGKTGLPKWIEIFMGIGTSLVLIIELFSIFLNVSFFPSALRILGICIGALAIWVFLMTLKAMGNNWRIGVNPNEKTELVVNGIYKYSRNPGFLAFDLLYLAILLMFFNYPLFLATIFAVIMLHLQIVNVEEDALIEKFGKDYLNYKKNVARYIGRKRKILV